MPKEKEPKEEKSFNQVVNIENARRRVAEKSDSEKALALKNVISQIDKQFGKNSLFKLGETAVDEFPHISFDILPLDCALGIGGMPRGRIAEIFGPESSGKTSMLLRLIRQVQKVGGIAAFIDAEHALDPAWAKFLGVNIDDLLVAQPENGEEALSIAGSLSESGAVDLIVVDSVAALIPRAELEGEMGDQFMGLQARMMGQAMRKLVGTVSRSNTCLFFSNQVRESMSPYAPTVQPGGRALKFFSTIRLEIRRLKQIKKGEEIVGNRIRVKVVKNKVAPPFRQADFDLFFEKGFDAEGAIIDTAVQFEIIEKAGAWFSYAGTRLGQGKANAANTIKLDPKLYEEIKVKTLTKLKESKALSLGVSSEEAVEPEPDPE